MEYTFNLNSSIKVRLKDKGYQILADEHNKYEGAYPSFKRRPAKDYKSRADERGYTTFQAWDFISTFSEYLKLGAVPPFHLDIIIDSKDLYKAIDMNELKTE